MATPAEQSLGERALAFAAEVQAVSAAHHDSLNLHHVAKDLALVLAAYAERLGVVAPVPVYPEPDVIAAQKASLAPSREAPQAQTVDDLVEQPFPTGGENVAEPPLPDSVSEDVGIIEEPASSAPSPDYVTREEFDALQRVVQDFLDAPLMAAPAESELPAWLLDALKSLDERVTALENRANFSTIEAAPQFQDEAPFNPDPNSWGSIEVARTALIGLVRREYAKLSAIRMNLLSRVTSLAQKPDLTDSEQAELRQHQSRVDTQEQLDVDLGRKLDEIAGIDDLDLAKAYDPKDGWA